MDRPGRRGVSSTIRSAAPRWPAPRGCWSRSATTWRSPRPRRCSRRGSSTTSPPSSRADTEATFRAFEMLLGRPIAEDEIEPRNAFYRRGGAALDAVTYLQSRAWIGMWARRMASWWTGHDLLLTPDPGRAPARAGLVHRRGAGGRGEAGRQLHPVHGAVQHDRPARGEPAAALDAGRPAGRRPARGRATAGRTCWSGWPASSSRPRRGRTGTRRCTPRARGQVRRATCCPAARWSGPFSSA